MNGTKYEEFVTRRMRWMLRFWSVRHTGKSGDYGADIIARDWLCRKVVVQCKHYHRPVGVKAVQEVIAAREYYRAAIAIVVTNSTFTKSAKQLARKCNVELWEKFK